MLSAVPDFVPTATWVQVIGRVAVHQDGETQRLTSSAQRLLAVLVAAGPGGATAERIAEEIWGDQQPNPWRPALRMAVARLRKQLPADWDIVAEGGFYGISTDQGWVDAWRLEKIASARTFILEDDLAWMLAGRPFGDIDLLELVTASTQNLQMLQIAVAERFCGQAPTRVATATCAVLTALVRDHPYNDRLAMIVAETLAASGRRTEALLALGDFAEAYISEFGVAPADISRFLATEATDNSVQQRASGPLSSEFPPADEIAKELRHLVETPMFGRDLELEMLRKSAGAIITGATGSGKSRLLAALIADDTETETSYVLGDDRLDLPLGPFAVAMPKLREDLLASATDQSAVSRDESSGDRAIATRAWRIVLAHLEMRAAGRPQRLVIDDAHLLDPASLGLLRLLIRSNTTAAVTFVVCGRSDSDEGEWIDLVRDSERAGLDSIKLPGLTPAALELLVRQRFPHATHRARVGLAADISELSAGLPAVAAPLIAAADPDTLALPEQLEGASALARITATLSNRAPEVVAAAAVLGHQFSIGALISLTGLDEALIFGVLDELWTTGLIIETEDPDQVRFPHVLIQRAFLEGVPLFRRGQLHRRAGELTNDPHERADHQANASALVSADVAAESLRTSALIYAERRNWRKVARELRRMNELPGDHLNTELLTLWASALDRSGADGSAQRRSAYQKAVETGAWEDALDAALSGLPESEKPDGDAARVDMLAAIEDTPLPSERRFDRVYNLGRQYSLLGNCQDKVLTHADLALSMARNPDEVGLSHLLRWLALRHSVPQAHQIPVTVMETASPPIRVRIAQANALILAERGDFAAAKIEAERFTEMAIQLDDPLRIWHANGMRGMFLLNAGDFQAADDLAMENLKFADLHDLPHGVEVFVGHRVFSLRLQGRLAEIQPELEPYRSNLSQLIMGRAGLLAADYAAGKTDVGDEVRALVTDAHSHSASAFSLLADVLVVRLVPEFAPDLVPNVRARLEAYGDFPILAGFGAASFGPASRYVAQLATDPDERGALIAQSIAAADRHGALLWRVRARLDYAEAGSANSLGEAKELAHGTGLAAMVETMGRRLRG